MNLVGWTPFERLLGHSLFPICWSDNEPGQAPWKPLVDIYDDDKEVIITAELPGVDRKDISIDVHDRVLTLRAVRSQAGEVKEERYHRRERALGRFERSFRLPADIDSDAIKAEYKDGVLRIDIPKPEVQKPKQITVH